MADSSNSTLLPKTHPGLSRRALMREMAAAGALIATPVAVATAAITPHERLAALIKEMQAVAREISPEIEDWKIHINLDSKLYGCPLLIAAFHPHPTPGAEPHVAVGWTYSHGGRNG